ncbi:MAG: hypothetical protein B7C24_16570 [Bacteroidetes bacterium 4572_77]|nr:MAG: hypothetical protein B7C24_16570 [Bacteroidetes bacterium 4572_77]
MQKIWTTFLDFNSQMSPIWIMGEYIYACASGETDCPIYKLASDGTIVAKVDTDAVGITLVSISYSGKYFVASNDVNLVVYDRNLNLLHTFEPQVGDFGFMEGKWYGDRVIGAQINRTTMAASLHLYNLDYSTTFDLSVAASYFLGAAFNPAGTGDIYVECSEDFMTGNELLIKKVSSAGVIDTEWLYTLTTPSPGWGGYLFLLSTGQLFLTATFAMGDPTGTDGIIALVNSDASEEWNSADWGTPPDPFITDVLITANNKLIFNQEDYLQKVDISETLTTEGNLDNYINDILVHPCFPGFVTRDEGGIVELWDNLGSTSAVSVSEDNYDASTYQTGLMSDTLICIGILKNKPLQPPPEFVEEEAGP